MQWNRLMFAFPCLLVATVLLIAGCNQPSGQNQNVAQNGKDADKKGQKKADDHGWWCEEHGVPEDICSLCASEEKVKEFKAKGDWCELHDRAKSQCFKCDPSKYERFAAMYRAKFGKEPPKPPQSEFEK
jgi:hypothetical protein